MKSITVDYGKRLADEPGKGHNRWHEAIAPVIVVGEGEEVEIQTRDAFDGQITAETTADDLRTCDLNLVHPLTGPVFVARAAPGDLLEVEICDMKPAGFGYTVQVPGFGFLRDAFPEPYIAKWTIKDGFAESADLPGVRIPDGSFVGVIGVAPSKALRETIRRREASLLDRGGMVLLPETQGAVPAIQPIASEALRTIPPRENGGNLDIKQLSKGARLLLPVFVDGALFSVGDAHFAQGDGEACGTAIENGRRNCRALHGAQGQRRAPRHPLSALRPRRLLFPARARRPQALPRDDRAVDPRGRHQRERGCDIERAQCSLGDDRPLGRARLEPAAGLCHLQCRRRPQIERTRRRAEHGRQRIPAA
jgi:formamidase